LRNSGCPAFPDFEAWTPVDVVWISDMPHHLEFENWIPFPLRRVFAFFSNPENLPRLMPAATHTTLDSLTRMPPPAAPSGSLMLGPSNPNHLYLIGPDSFQLDDPDIRARHSAFLISKLFVPVGVEHQEPAVPRDADEWLRNELIFVGRGAMMREAPDNRID